MKFMKSAHRFFATLFSFKASSPILKCRRCHYVLKAPKRATGIQNTLCWGCSYLAHGGYVPQFPHLSDFAIYRDLFKKNVVSYDEIWSGQTLYKGLIQNGRLALQAIQEKRSLTPEERNITFVVRQVALEYGYSQSMINSIEMEGAGYFHA